MYKSTSVPATNNRLYTSNTDIPGHLEGRLPNLQVGSKDNTDYCQDPAPTAH